MRCICLRSALSIQFRFSFLSVDYLAHVFDVLKTDLKDDVVSKQCCASESYILCLECNKIMKAKTDTKCKR